MVDQVIFGLSRQFASFFQDDLFYAFLQIGVFLAFTVTALRTWRSSRQRTVELFSAVLFGLLLEQGDILIFGTYRYNKNWILIGDVPLAIALTWSMVIAGAMNLSDALGVPGYDNFERYPGRRGTLRWLASGLPAPLSDALWALLLDVALDAIAIRIGLWTWTIPLDEGWFGVPWGNFIGWLFVAAFFSFFTRLVRSSKRGSWQWLVPFLSFAGLIGVLVPFVRFERMISSSYNNAVWVIFAITLAIFILTVWYGSRKAQVFRRGSPDSWLLLVRLTIHGLFLFSLLATGIFLQLPILLVVSLTLLAIEFWLMRDSLRDLFTQRLLLFKSSCLPDSWHID